MKLTIDTDGKTLVQHVDGKERRFDLYGREAFELLSHQWLRLAWNQKYTYTFSWLGRPIIQLPEDIVRAQEVIHRVRPDVLVETGVAHGGSLIFYASLFKAMGSGRVVGVDIEIRAHNRAAIEAHPLSPFITLVEGDSLATSTVQHVESLVKSNERVMLVLDSCHTKAHVAGELARYHHLVTPGSYAVVTDGFMKDLHDVPRGDPQWKSDNPVAATLEFLQDHPEFELEQPQWPFNESDLTENLTHWPSAWLRRKE
ncbi:MAG: CmcI family methyltransferase [Polyangiaceae bacterium]